MIIQGAGPGSDGGPAAAAPLAEPAQARAEGSQTLALAPCHHVTVIPSPGWCPSRAQSPSSLEVAREQQDNHI